MLEASLGDVRVHRAADGCDALPGAAPLGYELLALHTPDATHAVLASLLGALAAAGAAPHLPSVRSWAVDGAAPSGTLRVALAKPAQTLEQALDGALDYAALYGADGCVPAAERPTTLFGAAAAPPVADRYSGVAADDDVGAQQPSPPPLVTYSGGSVPRLSLERVSSVTALRKLEGEAAAVTPPTPPPNPAEAYGDFVLFAVCHTLALLQDACELQHNALTPATVHLVPASALHFRGAPLASRPHLTYVWGDAVYTFRTPALVPVVGTLDGASARVDGALVDRPPPSLRPPYSERLDAASFFGAARKALPCSGVVRERLDALLMSGASFATNRNDPWEAYRQPAAAAAVPWHHPALVAHRALEWLPDKATARDANGGDFLARLDGDTLKRLSEGGGVGGDGGGGAAAYTAAETAKLRELYIKAKVGEARAPRRRSSAREGVGGEGGARRRRRRARRRGVRRRDGGGELAHHRDARRAGVGPGPRDDPRRVGGGAGARRAARAPARAADGGAPRVARREGRARGVASCTAVRYGLR